MNCYLQYGKDLNGSANSMTLEKSSSMKDEFMQEVLMLKTVNAETAQKKTSMLHRPCMVNVN